MGSDLTPAPVGFDADRLLALAPWETRQTYGVKDTILYALGVGATADELEFVFEDKLEALPTLAVVLAYPGFWAREPKYGIDWRRLLHVEQQLEIHRDIPVQGDVVSALSIDDIIDKGADKGALMYSSRKLRDRRTDEVLATVSQVTYLRGDGGKGGRKAESAPRLAFPSRTADETIVERTGHDLAAIYRLSGDFNPLHIDPAAAAAAGFDRPILHGLATYGVVGRLLVKALRRRGGRRLTGLNVRFSAPVFPGDTLRTEIWWEKGRAVFKTFVEERAKEVLSDGEMRFS